MSHFATIETSFTDKGCLVEALRLVYGDNVPIEVHDDAVIVNGYAGKTMKANIIVRQKHLQGCNYSDLGFLKTKSGYKVVVDEMNRVPTADITRNYLAAWIGKQPGKYRLLSAKEDEIQLQVLR